MDLTTIAGVREYMSQAKNKDDWNDRCDAVKTANGGYPSFWRNAIIVSGLADWTASQFGGSAEIKVESIDL